MAESASLYRRHRPQSFGEVVGQEHIVRTLSNAVEKGRVHHAYLFVGSRGTGKTSMAKILARSLNCVQGPTLEPCGECEPCRTIAAGTSLDVIEMDAASNRSVDDIRELRDRVGYAPAAGRWKVYILDEAHMLTKEAWNAFLKTLEEPPPNTAFVLATTEPQKVMATIVDRCQRFDFQRPSLEQIAVVIRRVATAEEIQIDDGATALISRSASGSFRDALGTLDQLVAFGGESVTTDEVVELLGVADAELLFDTTDALANEDAKAALEAVERLARSGRDPGQFARDLIAHLRQLLVARATGEVPESFTVTVAQPERLAGQAKGIDDAKLMGAIEALSGAVAAMREGDDPRLTLEVALLKVATPSLDASREALLRRIESLESRLSGGGRPVKRPQKARPAMGPRAELLSQLSRPSESGSFLGPLPRPPLHRPRFRRPMRLPPKQASPRRPSRSRRSGSSGPRSSTICATPAPRCSRRCSTRPGRSGSTRSARFCGSAFRPPPTSTRRRRSPSPNVERMTEALASVAGHRLRPVYELIDEPGEGAAPEKAPEMSEDELVDLVKDSFDASEVAPDDARESGAG